jgi:hypothetical protein
LRFDSNYRIAVSAAAQGLFRRCAQFHVRLHHEGIVAAPRRRESLNINISYEIYRPVTLRPIGAGRCGALATIIHPQHSIKLPRVMV